MNSAYEPPKVILKVRFYKTASGREPVREWLKSLPKKVKKTIGDDIKTVQQGWPLGMPLVKHMGGHLLEIRSTLPDGIARVLFVVNDLAMILLHGFIKKTEKTPAKELDTARKRAKNLEV
jgi:phage-related protein